MDGMLRNTAFTVLGVLGFYLLVRGIAEFFVIDFHDPASYRNDWGGPSLVGVLAVHSLPGFVALGGGIAWLRRQVLKVRRNG